MFILYLQRIETLYFLTDKNVHFLAHDALKDYYIHVDRYKIVSFSQDELLTFAQVIIQVTCFTNQHRYIYIQAKM